MSREYCKLPVQHMLRLCHSIQRTITITIIYVARDGVAPPCGERARHARRAEYRKGEDEDHDLCTTVERATQDVVVLAVPARVVAPQPELRRDADDDAREDGRICAGRHPR